MICLFVHCTDDGDRLCEKEEISTWMITEHKYYLKNTGKWKAEVTLWKITILNWPCCSLSNIITVLMSFLKNVFIFIGICSVQAIQQNPNKPKKYHLCVEVTYLTGRTLYWQNRSENWISCTFSSFTYSQIYISLSHC